MNPSPLPDPGNTIPTHGAADLNRRDFIAGAAARSAGLSLAWRRAALLGASVLAPGIVRGSEGPALLGGRPVRREPFPGWPVIDRQDEESWLEALRSGQWFRGNGARVNRFEEAYAKLMGARHCIATANGTSALFASLGGLDIGPGDEVLLPPYTFVATLNVILLQHALPIFVDTDPATFQINAAKVETAITERTTAMIPVHLGGNVADLDRLLEIARRRRLRVIEDACQAHLAEWRDRPVGTWGDAGCFSFQASKNLNCGEGGAILTNDPELADRCYAFHNNSRGRQGSSLQGARGANLRLTEFQGGLLLSQMRRLEEQSRTREGNAAYLTEVLSEIPGIAPAAMYSGCTRNAYHLYMFRYQSDHFAGLPRSRFMEALRAEGIPCSGGYTPLNREEILQTALNSRGYRRIYPPELLKQWEERNQCPANDQLCREAVWFTQTMFLGTRSDMDQIAEAITRIRTHAARLAAG
jgi:dTDP-4-amino-4,6-dideoxygalactose transaminase